MKIFITIQWFIFLFCAIYEIFIAIEIFKFYNVLYSRFPNYDVQYQVISKLCIGLTSIIILRYIMVKI